MNLKLNNDTGSSRNFFRTHPKGPISYVKEERRRTGRYIAILVGISLLLLACYHAWVRRIPVVASLVVPALIMFVYVGWVLYSAARDKHRHMLLDAEAAKAAAENEMEASTTDLSPNVEISVIPNREASKPPQETLSQTARVEMSSYRKGDKDGQARQFVMPIILINDKPPDDLDDKSIQLETAVNTDKLKQFPTRRKFKRKFCRSRRYAVFKRSYSIA